MVLILHKIDLSLTVRAVYMTMEILGLEAKMVEVNIQTGGNRTPEFLAKNPMHTVPVLEDGDFILADSHAINIYLVSKYGAAKKDLYPNDYKLKAIIDQHLYFDTSVLFHKFRPIMNHIVMDGNTSPSPQNISDVEDAYSILERYLEKQQFLAGNKLTLADISVVATISSMEIFVPVTDKFPKLFDWLERMKQTDFYKKGNQPGLEDLTVFWNNIIEKNVNKSRNLVD